MVGCGANMNSTAPSARKAVARIVSRAARPNLPRPLLTISATSTGRHNSASANTTAAKTDSGTVLAKKTR